MSHPDISSVGVNRELFKGNTWDDSLYNPLATLYIYIYIDGDTHSPFYSDLELFLFHLDLRPDNPVIAL